MSDADDVDQRFREMMLAEFGGDTKPRTNARRDSHHRRSVEPTPRHFLTDDSQQRPHRRGGASPEPGSLAENLAALSDSAEQMNSTGKGRDYWFSMSEALDNVELDPEPPYRESGSWFRPSFRGWLAIGGLLLAIVLTILVVNDVIGVNFGLLAGLLFGTSIALALSLIPWRRDGGHDFDDGARV